MNVSEWLNQLGLGQYAELFADNRIDLDILPDLTEADLERLGIPLGDRKRLLKASASLSDRPVEHPAPEGSPDRPPEAERRQLTVMFCDLVGSTGLSERLDPEDLREVLRSYQETCAEAVARFEGHVAKYIGDGLLVYFGYPQAHEDDARRAVSAGLGIVEGVGGLNQRLAEGSGVELGVRVGIHTGLVVAGEMGGGETREAEAIVGETPNVAARMEGLAKPNTVAISAATHALVQGLFECDDLGPQRLKGVSESVGVYRVLGESAAQSRFEASAHRGLTALVGREEETALLMKRWAQTRDGDGQVVLLSGEAGVGKSRVVRAFRDRLETEPHNLVLYFCSPYHQNSALYPAIAPLERGMRYEKSDGVETRLEKLEAGLSKLGLPVDELAPLLINLLSLPAGARYPEIVVSPQLLRRKTLEAILSPIEAMAAREPVLMVVEDAHWIDPSTLEMLGLLIERSRSARILLLITHRPVFAPPWGAHAHVSVLGLNRLSRKECGAMIVEVTGGKALPDDVFDQIVARTDGVPLFIEELTKTLLESEHLEETDDGYALKGPLPEHAIPASVQDLLMARLDRLGPTKEVAQLAAMLGRSFSLELLAAVSALSQSDLADALSQLEAAELVFRRGVAPDIIYQFKHALVQDAAYQSLLKSSRQRDHRRIAQVLEEEFPATAENEPEILAHHYTEAGLAAEAAERWLKAGRRAMQRSAHAEAEGHLGKGLTVLQDLPEAPERKRLEIAIQNTLGVCLMPTRGFGNPDVAGAFSRAAEICEDVGDPEGLFVALRGQGQYHMISGDLHTAQGHVTRIMDIAEGLEDDSALIEAHHLGWSTLCFTGDFEAARQHAREVIARYEPERHHRLTYTYSGHDPGMCCRVFGSLASWQLGYPDEALDISRQGNALARSLAHPFTVAISLWGIGLLYTLRRETGAMRETGNELIAYCAEKGIPPMAPMGRIFNGGAMAEDGELAEGVAEMRAGLAVLQANGQEYTLPTFFAWIADVCAKGGLIEDGLGALEEGMAMARKNHDRFVLPEFHRVEGNLLLARSGHDKAKADAAFTKALEVARNQNAKSLELRAAVSLARFWGEKGKKSEARDMLAPIHGWFTEGFDTPDLKDAKALLNELS